MVVKFQTTWGSKYLIPQTQRRRLGLNFAQNTWPESQDKSTKIPPANLNPGELFFSSLGHLVVRILRKSILVSINASTQRFSYFILHNHVTKGSKGYAEDRLIVVVLMVLFSLWYRGWL